MKVAGDQWGRPVREFVHREFITLDDEMPVSEALQVIRSFKDENKVMYFYTLDDIGRLTGVVPVRKLLFATPETPLKDISIKSLVTVNEHMTLLEAARTFHNYKYLSIPVVRDNGSVLGVVDLKQFVSQDLDLSNRIVMDEVFQTIGVHIENVKVNSIFSYFKNRFPWLISTILAGFLCAVFSSFFALTLSQVLILSFFLALVLALGDSVSIQSLSFSLQEWIKPKASRRSLPKLLFREISVAFFLGICSGSIVGALSLVLEPRIEIALVMALSITMALINAALIGLLVPAALYRWKVDPKIASGPLVLALTDVSTLLTYFSLGTIFLVK